MGRIRTVKPEFFKHDELFDAEVEFGLPLRLAFIGLWTQCDREGRFAWRERRLKAEVFPYDDIDMARVLDALATRGFVVRYVCKGRVYGFIPGFLRHQVINNREAKSELPSPPKNVEETNDCTGDAREADASPTREVRALGEGKGREGKGREGEGSVSNETDAKASQPENLNSRPSKAVDPFKSCFDAGRNLLGAYGIGKGKQGQLIAKWKRELANNPEALMAVLLEAQSRERADIVSYVQGSVNSRANGRKPSSPNLYSGPARNGIDEVLGNG